MRISTLSRLSLSLSLFVRVCSGSQWIKTWLRITYDCIRRTADQLCLPLRADTLQSVTESCA